MRFTPTGHETQYHFSRTLKTAALLVILVLVSFGASPSEARVNPHEDLDSLHHYYFNEETSEIIMSSSNSPNSNPDDQRRSTLTDTLSSMAAALRSALTPSSPSPSSSRHQQQQQQQQHSSSASGSPPVAPPPSPFSSSLSPAHSKPNPQQQQQQQQQRSLSANSAATISHGATPSLSSRSPSVEFDPFRSNRARSFSTGLADSSFLSSDLAAQHQETPSSAGSLSPPDRSPQSPFFYGGVGGGVRKIIGWTAPDQPGGATLSVIEPSDPNDSGNDGRDAGSIAITDFLPGVVDDDDDGDEDDDSFFEDKDTKGSAAAAARADADKDGHAGEDRDAFHSGSSSPHFDFDTLTVGVGVVAGSSAGTSPATTPRSVQFSDTDSNGNNPLESSHQRRPSRPFITRRLSLFLSTEENFVHPTHPHPKLSLIGDEHVYVGEIDDCRDVSSSSSSSSSGCLSSSPSSPPPVSLSELFSSPYRSIRAILDYAYHSNYSLSRQNLQDQIVADLLSTSTVTDKDSGVTCSTPTHPWIVFTAGSMGAGKSYTIGSLMQYSARSSSSAAAAATTTSTSAGGVDGANTSYGYGNGSGSGNGNGCNNDIFPLLAFVGVDPDTIRRYLPEFGEYCQHNPLVAGELTRKESGYITEILTEAALKEGKNVLVDGSLRDHAWYSAYFDRLRKDYPNLRIAIIMVTAPAEDVLQRAEARGKATGRIVPKEVLLDAIEQVPISVNILKSKVDYFVELTNCSSDDDIKIVVEGKDGAPKRAYGLKEIGQEREDAWSAFGAQWMQTCKWVPHKKLPHKKDLGAEDEREMVE